LALDSYNEAKYKKAKIETELKQQPWGSHLKIPKLHETGKRYEVSETGTIRNRPSKNGNVGGNAGGNAVYKKIKKNIYIYSFKKNNALYCKKNIMIHINDILEGKPCLY